ncbi:MAG: hypothetical protein BroJett026_00320 [Betaproteobacteria bacterium]|nr:MAG: hypothetical protein BroJett026_00320 [Betaproteobacteria bacterium]
MSDADRRRRPGAVAALGSLLLVGLFVAAGPAAAQPKSALKDLMGVYLGRVTVRDLDTQKTEERDIDVEVRPFERNGFRIRWTNVTLVDGRRNVPGVKRRVSELAFRPARGGAFYVEAPQVDVFVEREETTPMGGDPVRWAVNDAAGLHVYSFTILDDGRYELQSYSRRRTAGGIDLRYERVVDGRTLRTIEGAAVKIE